MFALIQTKPQRGIVFLVALFLALCQGRAAVAPGVHLLAQTSAPADGSNAAAELGGTVMDTSGAMVAGARVTVRNAAGQTQSAVTDTSGLFQITGLSAGKYQLLVTAPGFAELADEMTISADEPSLLFSIVLYPQGRELSGKVTDTTGAAVAGATVRLRNAAGESKSAVTDKEGKFQFERLAPDRYGIAVTAKGYAGYVAAGLSVRAGEPAAPLAIVLFPNPSNGPTVAKVEQAPTAPTAIAVAHSAPVPAEQAPAPAPVEAAQPQMPVTAPPAVVHVAPAPQGATGITGTVVDTSGAVIPGATVRIRAGSWMNTRF